jgi:hypothetical protein
LKEFNNNNSKWDKWEKEKNGKYDDPKYKWKLKAPKDGESTTKMVQVDGKNKKYHWCDHHKSWTIHSLRECKRQPMGKSKGRNGSRKSKKFNKKKAYMDAKAAIAALAYQQYLDDDSNKSASDSDDNSNTSYTMDGRYYSDEEGDSDSS